MVEAVIALALVAVPAARSVPAVPPPVDHWLPHPADGLWSFQWQDATYNPRGTAERVAVKPTTAGTSCGWQLSWTGDTQIPLGGAGNPSGGPVFDWPDNGTMCFREQPYGLTNTDWSSTPPPFNEPSLCAASASPGGCPNSLASALYQVIWGTRNPVLSEPLLRGTAWNATGGAVGSVTSANQYLGHQDIKVPAFPAGIRAAAIRSQIALAGTPGDAFGSGDRTVWWVYGVGPVMVQLARVDGTVSTAVLQATTLKPLPLPPDADYFPLRLGVKGTYKWTNRKHLPQPEVETVSVAAVASRSARIVVRSVSGPIRAAGQYLFSLRLDGLRNTFGSTAAATLLKFPRLGHGRRFFNPIDLMTFGFNPLLPAYPIIGSLWRSGSLRDQQTYGVTGSTRIVGLQTVRVPAGRFQALKVQSVLNQRGFRYGSGLRTMWFAADRGLVKLEFRHRDGSTSRVQLLR